MNEIQAQIVPADLNADGILELIAVDAVGSVAAWTATGDTLWEVQTSGLSAQTVSIASLRGDGTVQVIVATVAGAVHVLEGRTGNEVSPFPLRTGGKIMSSVTVVQLQANALVQAPDRLSGGGAGDTAPHLVFSSFDGYLYVVHALTGCVHKIDHGEHSYTQVLADDLTGNGRMDLLLSTMNGNLFTFETSTPYSPLRSWRAQAQGRNVFSPRETFMGIAVQTAGGRHTPLDIAGVDFPLTFAISDSRPRAGGAHGARYAVLVRLGGAVVHNHTYTAPGVYSITVPCPSDKWVGVLVVAMTNEHGQYFDDRITVSLNEGFREVIKWVALVPYVLAAMVVVASTAESRSALPL